MDQSTKDKLEGVWLQEAKPDNGSCARGEYLNYQLEFEFRKSGGRLLSYEPPDLIVGVPMLSASEIGGIIEIRYINKLGKPGEPIRLQFLDQNTMRQLSPGPHAEPSRDFPDPGLIHRCGVPDYTVTKNVPGSKLALLTPLTIASGITPWSPAFIEKVGDLSDSDTCSPKTAPPKSRKWAIFELFGPNHYYVLGRLFGDQESFLPIRAVRAATDGSLQVDIVRRAAEQNGDEWGSGVRGPTTTLTVVPHGTEIHISELSSTFVRCEAQGPVEKW